MGGGLESRCVGRVYGFDGTPLILTMNFYIVSTPT